MVILKIFPMEIRQNLKFCPILKNQILFFQHENSHWISTVSALLILVEISWVSYPNID